MVSVSARVHVLTPSEWWDGLAGLVFVLGHLLDIIKIIIFIYLFIFDRTKLVI